MNVLDAVHAVLLVAGSPLSATVITQRMLDLGLWATNGKTPVATVSARLAVDIKQHGPASRFRRVGKGLFTLGGDFAEPAVAVPLGFADDEGDVSRSDAVGNESLTVSGERSGPIGDVELAAEPSRTTMTFLDAAVSVLDRYGERRPMHYREIARIAMEQGLLQTSGRTPEATMYAQILTETKRRTRRGEQPRFVLHGKGLVGLAAWIDPSLATQIDRHNRDVRRALLERLKAMRWDDFEGLVGRLLTDMGFEDVVVTARHGDGGVDVRGTLMVGDVIHTRMAVQVKRWKGNVQAPVIQQVRGSLGAHEQGLIITTSDYSPGARIEALRSDATPVGLMNGEQLVLLLVEHEIGVRRTGHEIIDLDGDIDM